MQRKDLEDPDNEDSYRYCIEDVLPFESESTRNNLVCELLSSQNDNRVHLVQKVTNHSNDRKKVNFLNGTVNANRTNDKNEIEILRESAAKGIYLCQHKHSI